jgi:hypothetical protein
MTVKISIIRADLADLTVQVGKAANGQPFKSFTVLAKILRRHSSQ